MRIRIRNPERLNIERKERLERLVQMEARLFFYRIS
jgi:hypothetical protein